MKRFLAFVLSLCIVFSLLPVSTITVSAEPQQQSNTHTDHFACSCAITGASACAGHGTQAAPGWTEWTSDSTLPTAEGHYYLTKNVTLSAVTAISENVKLCLNGFNINLNGFKITNTGDLTILNCQATLNDKAQLTSENGKIYGGKNQSTGTTNVLKFGGAIGNSGNLQLYGVLFANNLNDIVHDCWGGGAVFTMEGQTTITSCKFYKNEAKATGSANNGSAGALSVAYNASATIMDSVFDSNKAQLYGGAVMVYNRDSSAGKDATKDTSVYIGGNSLFTGNQTPHTQHGYGSAIYVRQRAAAVQLTLTLAGNTEITGNVAAKNGALSLKSQTATKPLIAIVQDSVKICGNTGSTNNCADVHFDDANTKLTVGKLNADANILVGTTSNKEVSAFMIAGSDIATGSNSIFYKNKSQFISYNGTAFALSTVNKSQHACLCAISGVTCGVDHGTTAPLTWTAWANGSTLPTAAGNYYLLGDVKLAANAAIAANVKLDLNGYNINLNGFKITNTSDLTILNSKATLNDKGQLTSENGKIYGGKNQSAGATDVLKYGGAIGTSGNLTLLGVLFTNNLNDYHSDIRGGGAVFAINGTTTVRSCKFYQNESKDSATNGVWGPAGAICVADNANLSVTDSVFDSNKAELFGGAIMAYNRYATADNSVYIGGNSLFVGNQTTNTSDGNGGAIYLCQRLSGMQLTAVIEGNTEITGNTAAKNGALYLRTHSSCASQPLKITIQGNVKVYGNTASTANRANVTFDDTNTKLSVGTLGAETNIIYGTSANQTDPDQSLKVAAGVTLQPVENLGITYANVNSAVGYNTTHGFTFNHIHSGCICALTGETSCGAHTESLEWMPWTSNTALPTTGNYYLTKDVTLGDVAAITGTLKLDLNGCNINLNGKKITNTGDLTILNCKATLNNENQLTSENGKIYGGKNQSNGATNILKYGGAIGNSGKLQLIGVLFTGNLSDGPHDYYGGGAVFTLGGLTTISSSKFYQNEAKSSSGAKFGSGGAIAMADDADMVVTDTIFDNNKAQLLGGAIVTYNRYATKATSLVVDGNSVFTNNAALNTTDGNGSAIFVRQRIAGKQFTATIGGNTEITGNTATKNGAVALETHTDAASTPLKTIVKDSVKIYGNTAATDKAADLYVLDARTTVTVGKLNADANIHYGTAANQTDPDQTLKLADGVTLSETTNTGITYKNVNMQVGYSNVAGFTFNHVHGACGCVLTGNTTCTDGHTDGLDWAPWSDPNALPTTTGNYYLTVDVDLSQVTGTDADAIMKIATSSNVKLCMNGFNIKLNSDNAKTSTYWVPGTSSLTIINCQAKLDADNKLDLQNSVGGKISDGKGTMGGAILDYGKLNVVGVLFEGNIATPASDDGRGGGAIIVHKGSALVQYSYFKNNETTHYGAAISLWQTDKNATAVTSVTITDTVFDSNKAACGAVNVYTNASTRHGAEMTIRDSLFVNNEGTSKGGAIQLWRASGTDAAIAPKLTVTNTKFEGNTAKNGGAVLRVYGCEGKLTEATFTNCTITNNSAKASGGAFNVDYAALTLENVTMQGNKATSSGAVLYTNNSEVTMNNCTATGNEATSHGGVTYFNRTKAQINGGEYRGNKSGDCAGVFYISGDATMSEVTINGGTYAENTAKNEGGVSRVVKGHLTINGGAFKDNEAKFGGAISVFADPGNVISPTMTITGDAEFSGNKAVTGGALYLIRSSTAPEGIIPIVKVGGNTLIINNEATSYGGGIFLQRKASTGAVPELTLCDNLKIANNKSANGGAMWFGSVEDRATVSGNVVIDGNSATVGNDVYFFNKSQHLIVGELGSGAKISVTTKEVLGVADPDEFLKVAEGVDLQDTKNTGIIYASVTPAKGVGYSAKNEEYFYFTDVVATAHASHTACGCALNGSTCKDETLKWKPWPYTDRLPVTSGNWYLTKDVYVGELTGGSTGIFEIVKGQKVNLCLNGYSVKFNEKNTKSTNYYVASGASLTIMNCKATLDKDRNLVESSGGKIYGGVGTQGGAILNRGTLNLFSIHFTGNTATNKYDGQGGGALFLDRATSKIQSCLFTKNSTNKYGAAICQYAAGEATVTDTVFKENTGKMAGAISVYSTGSSVGTPTMTINGNNKFLKNVSEGAGSAIYIWRRNNTPAEHAPKVTIDGALFSENSAVGKGAIRIRGTVNKLTTVTITNAEFKNNKSSAGGAISTESATLNISGCTFTKNTVTSGGGAIHSVTTDILLEKSTFTSNTTSGAGGGAIQASTGALKINECTFEKNSTTKNDGGAIRLWEKVDAQIKDTKFSQNKSSCGGAFSLFRGSKLHMTATEFTKNHATANGGAVYANTTSTETTPYEMVEVVFDDVVLSGNTSDGGGQGMYARDSKVTLNGGKLIGNTGKHNGGALFITRSGENISELTINGTEISKNTSYSGAGMYLLGVDAKLINAVIKDNTTRDNGGAIHAKTAKVTIEKDVTISGNKAKNGGGIYLQAKSEVTTNGCTIKGNTAERGGGVYVTGESTKWIVAGTKVTGNEGTVHAGGAYAGTKGEIILRSGTITGNTAKNYAGAIYLYSKAKMQVYGGYIGYNVAAHGGGLYIRDGEANLYGSVFEHNEAKTNGGGICVSTNGKLLINGALLQNNEAYGRGGAVRVDIDGVVTLKSGQIIENVAGGTGGGMSIDGDAEILGGKISYNKVVGNEDYVKPRGGGIASNCQNSIYSQGFSNITISGGEITHNESAMNGGGIYMGGRTTMTITGGVIAENTAAQLGGGIIVDNHFTGRASMSILRVSGGDIYGNTAIDGGGIYSRYAARVYLTDVTIHDNVAAGNGGGVCLDKGTMAELTNLTLSANKGGKGSGLYFLDDTTINGLTVTDNEATDGYAVYLDRGEYDGQSYILSSIKLSGDIRVLDNKGTDPDMFIGEGNVLVVDGAGFGEHTKFNVDLEKGVLTSTILGAYDYEGGNLKYVVTYGDRSLTELEAIPVEEEEAPATETTEPTETGTADAEPASFGIGGVIGISAGLIVVVIAALAVVAAKKKKKAEKTAESSVQE